MSVQINPDDIRQIAEVASIVGTIVFALVMALVVYLLVRPSRKNRQRRAEQDADMAAENAQLWRVVDLMERRLEVLERALADQLDRPRIEDRDARDTDRLLSPAEDGRDLGRTK